MEIHTSEQSHSASGTHGQFGLNIPADLENVRVELAVVAAQPDNIFLDIKV